MPFKRTSMRYAHTTGHTSCTYTEDGNYLITCGSDGDMRNWVGIDDDDPSSKCLGEFVLCVVHFDERILVSTDMNTVQAYTFPKGDLDGTEFRFTAPVNCIKVNKNYIAAGSEDTEIKIIRKDKTGNEICLEGGHKGPILAIDISVKENILASCSGDGTLKIWDFDKKSEIKTFDGLPKCNSLAAAKFFGTPSFHPITGQSLAYPLKKEIIVLNASTWEIQFTLVDEKIKNDYSCCQYSPDGQYIAAGTCIGEISIWNVAKKESVKGETNSSEPSYGITSIVWNPKCNGELAFVDSTGQLGTIIGCFDENTNEIDDDDDINQIGGDNDNIESDFNDIEFQNNDNDSGDDNENCISLEKLKNETMKNNNLIDDNDMNEDDKLSDTKSIKSYSETRQYMKTFKQQVSFQPGSSPIDLKSRYLVWNDIGIVCTHSDNNSIDVEFHDVSVHHGIHLNNYLNHDLASLSSTVLALAPSNTDKLVCITFGVHGSGEWSTELPNGEGIVAIVATEKLIGVCTDNRLLRIFSVLGTQREVISIPGPIIAICGRGNKLMVTYHNAPANEDQHITGLLLQCFGLTLRSKETRIPLTPGKKLTWIGYSDKGSPVCCDTMGLVQMYSMKTGCWYPICDTMKHSQSVSNNFFLIYILESKQIIQCVLCRAATHPQIQPRPMVTELSMQIPLCDIETEKSMLEDSLVRWSNFDVDNSEKLIKESAIKLFSIACRAEIESRAKELIEMLALPSLVSLASKYASKLGRVHLADKLNDLAPKIEMLEKEHEKEIQETETNILSILHNNSIGSSLLMMQQQSTQNDTKKYQQLTPKPIVLSKKNPFKRSIGNNNSSNRKNSLSHLTENVSGFDSGGNTQLTNETVTETVDLLSENNENKSENESSKTPGSFTDWFQKNKDRLAKLHPDSNNLTKIGMTEYKMLNNNKEILSDVPPGKRKLEEEPEGKKTGIAKLAKFGFKR